MPIKVIWARQIYDSRGIPTIQCELVNEFGLFRSEVPSGNLGNYEAEEIRDNHPEEFHGLGVCTAVKNINDIIAPEFIKSNIEVTNQKEIDAFLKSLDGTPNKAKLGANAILAVSMVCCKAGAAKKGVPLYRHLADFTENKSIVLPVPFLTVISGGVPAGNGLSMREFMIVPSGVTSFSEAMRLGTEVFHNLEAIIVEKYGKDAIRVGDEGGIVAPLVSNKDALFLICDAIKEAGHTGKVEIAIDVAASDFCKEGAYDVDYKNPKSNSSDYLPSDSLADMYQVYLKEFPIVSIEDPFDREDWNAWNSFKSKNTIQIVSNELTATNVQRIEEAVERDACNCLMIKINQIGTVTEAIDVYKMAKSHNWGSLISYRLGETDEPFIANLAVALSCGQIKAGAPCRSEHLAKYNQILRIEEELAALAKYAGKNFRFPMV